MKKNKHTVWTLSFLLLLLSNTACNKEQSIVSAIINDETSYKDIPNINPSGFPWLSFSSVENYEDAVGYLSKCESEIELDVFESRFGFTSARRYYAEEVRDAMGLTDDILATLLNPEGKIQICNYIIIINMLNETLYMYDTSNVTDTLVVSTDNDIIDYIAGNIPLDSLKAPAIPSKNLIKYDSYTNTIPYLFAGSTYINVRLKASVSNSGILSTIYCKISIDNIIVGSNRPYLYLSVGSDSYYKYKSTGTRMGIEQKTLDGKYKSRLIVSYCGFRRINIHDYKYNVTFDYGDNELQTVDDVTIGLPIYINN